MLKAVGRHVNPATILALVALVFAMSGGAYALSGGGGKAGGNGAESVAQAAKKKGKSKSSKGARGPAGPKGATGAAGPAGPAGPTGPAGATGSQGPAGAKGENGANGSSGTNGKSVVVGKTAPGCAEGGITVEAEGSGVKNEVCNGEEGTPGKEGEPGAIHPGETLPKDASETGVWQVLVDRPADGEEEPAWAPISFTIPLAKRLPSSAGDEHALIVQEGQAGIEHASECPGTLEEPKAAPGYLCVYVGIAYEMTVNNIGAPFSGEAELTGGPGTTGALVYTERAASSAYGEAAGTWAVTAE